MAESINLSTNWGIDETKTAQHKSAIEVLTKVKREKYSKGKQYKLVKVSDNPTTWKEIEIT